METKKIEKPVIYVDSRERDKRILEVLNVLGAEIKFQQLEVGDYVCSQDVVVERKTTDDLLTSIIDQRLFTQLNEMQRNYAKPLMIIEGTDLFEKRNMHPNAIRGVLASIVLDYSVPILWTKNKEETAAQIFWIAKREQFGYNNSITIRAKKKLKTMREKQKYLLAGIPKVSSKVAERLLVEFETPEKVFCANEEELEEVSGIGEALAKGIRKLLTTKTE